jgi:hypothetical protein
MADDKDGKRDPHQPEAGPRHEPHGFVPRHSSVLIYSPCFIKRVDPVLDTGKR